ncbi:hypothetical protein PLICRDRAFT_463697 [Plicaturopsis crispa FD-325 SS-3]|nr:hypothetical protein PLICRDRAFT_463697 [Plicaturopsis crispa FD-325 SS-3]
MPEGIYHPSLILLASIKGPRKIPVDDGYYVQILSDHYNCGDLSVDLAIISGGMPFDHAHHDELVPRYPIHHDVRAAQLTAELVHKRHAAAKCIAIRARRIFSTMPSTSTLADMTLSKAIYDSTAHWKAGVVLNRRNICCTGSKTRCILEKGCYL